MAKVVVTGGSGRLGTWVVKEFVDHGYTVVNADIKPPGGESLCRTVILDLKELGGVYGVFEEADAVVHLAAIPSPGGHPNEVVYHNNVMSTFNVLEAAAGLGIRKVVIASSESSYGICFAKHRFGPQYVPIDEEHPQLTLVAKLRAGDMLQFSDINKKELVREDKILLENAVT